MNKIRENDEGGYDSGDEKDCGFTIRYSKEAMKEAGKETPDVINSLFRSAPSESTFYDDLERYYSSWPQTKMTDFSLEQLRGVSVLTEFDRLFERVPGKFLDLKVEPTAMMFILKIELYKLLNNVDKWQVRPFTEEPELDIALSTLLWSVHKRFRTEWEFSTVSMQNITTLNDAMKYVMMKFGGVATCISMGKAYARLQFGDSEKQSDEDHDVNAQYGYVMSTGVELVSLVDTPFTTVEIRDASLGMMREVKRRAPLYYEQVLVLCQRRKRQGIPFNVIDYVESLEERDRRRALKQKMVWVKDGAVVSADDVSKEQEQQVVKDDVKCTPETEFCDDMGRMEVTPIALPPVFADVIPEKTEQCNAVLTGKINIPVPCNKNNTDGLSKLVDAHFLQYDINVYAEGVLHPNRLKRPCRAVGVNTFYVVAPGVCDSLYVKQTVDSGSYALCEIKNKGEMMGACMHVTIRGVKKERRDFEYYRIPYCQEGAWTMWRIVVHLGCGGLFCRSGRTLKLFFQTEKAHSVSLTVIANPPHSEKVYFKRHGDLRSNVALLRRLFPYFIIRRYGAKRIEGARVCYYLEDIGYYFLGFESRWEMLKAFQLRENT